MAEFRRSLLLKYGELILKGDNRAFFENALLRDVRKKLSAIGEFDVSVKQSTVFIDTDDDLLIDEAFPAMQKVFGVISIALAYRTEKNMDDVLLAVREKIAPRLTNYRSFKADARRSDKKFPLTSPEISAAVGEEILKTLGKSSPKVDVHSPEITVWTEIRDRYAYVHAGKTDGAGGMPLGTSGRVMLLLSGGIDSPVAGWRMARRGAEIYAVYFESYPYTSEKAREKVVTLAKRLAEYTGSVNLTVASLTDIQLELKEKCREEYFTLLLRRSMVRIANAIAERMDCKALVTGESLGQVASQTLDAIALTDSVSEKTVFRPLIGSDKEEIVETSRKIGCFEISCLPYEDCCTVFTPKHPKLRPTKEEAEKEESLLDLMSLEEKAVMQAVSTKITK